MFHSPDQKGYWIWDRVGAASGRGLGPPAGGRARAAAASGSPASTRAASKPPLQLSTSRREREAVAASTGGSSSASSTAPSSTTVSWCTGGRSIERAMVNPSLRVRTSAGDWRSHVDLHGCVDERELFQRGLAQIAQYAQLGDSHLAEDVLDDVVW